MCSCPEESLIVSQSSIAMQVDVHVVCAADHIPERSAAQSNLVCALACTLHAAYWSADLGTESALHLECSPARLGLCMHRRRACRQTAAAAISNSGDECGIRHSMADVICRSFTEVSMVDP